MIRRVFTAIALGSFVLATAVNAQDSKSKAAPKAAAAAAAPTGGQLYSQSAYDFMLKEQMAQGRPDSAELRNAIREELTNRELVVRAAKQKGLDKDPTVKAQTDLAAQNVLVRAYIMDYVKAHPVADDVLHKEYDTIKGQMGNKEYKVRHILVDKEDEAKEIIAALQKGEKFEKLAERSKDPGSKANGGDLDWHVPSDFVKPFSDAMIALPKGKFSAQPVQTQFGFHVLQVDDVRDAKIPTFDEVKPQLTQRAQGQAVEKMIADLKAKAALK
jgi:peptidyl-prolyl cis-trans isomerase C